jgi:hypothetical protein
MFRQHAEAEKLHRARRIVVMALRGVGAPIPAEVLFSRLAVASYCSSRRQDTGRKNTSARTSRLSRGDAGRERIFGRAGRHRHGQ